MAEIIKGRCLDLNETTLPTSVPESSPAETMLLRIRLGTTSDWTNLFLVSGATWEKHGPILADQEATTADMQGDRLTLNQPILFKRYDPTKKDQDAISFQGCILKETV